MLVFGYTFEAPVDALTVNSCLELANQIGFAQVVSQAAQVVPKGKPARYTKTLLESLETNCTRVVCQ
jgi:hypothetical protein